MPKIFHLSNILKYFSHMWFEMKKLKCDVLGNVFSSYDPLSGAPSFHRFFKIISTPVSRIYIYEAYIYMRRLL